MEGKICLVTGATGGLGLATALDLARLGATVVIVGRNPRRIERAMDLINEAAGNCRAEALLADLSKQAEVRRVAGEFLARHDRLDVLVNNVGGNFLRGERSPDGLEMTWALNYLNHFLLTHLLLDALKSAARASGEARIVEITSTMYRFSDPRFDRLPQGGPIQGILAYAKSKRAMIVYTAELARRLRGSGVTINTVTPGWVRSNMASGNGWLADILMGVINFFALPTAVGVRPIVRLATDPALCGVSGRYFFKYKEMPADPTCHDSVETAHLWQLSEGMLGNEK